MMFTKIFYIYRSIKLILSIQVELNLNLKKSCEFQIHDFALKITLTSYFARKKLNEIKIMSIHKFHKYENDKDLDDYTIVKLVF